MYLKRIVLDIVLLLAVMFGFWYVALILGLYGLFRHPLFIEIICAGVIYDMLFRVLPDSGIRGYTGSLVALAVFLFYMSIRSAVRK